MRDPGGCFRAKISKPVKPANHKVQKKLHARKISFPGAAILNRKPGAAFELAFPLDNLVPSLGQNGFILTFTLFLFSLRRCYPPWGRCRKRSSRLEKLHNTRLR
jgi:hypothetical protein